MPGLPSARAWGDGVSTRTRHLIADIRYRPNGESLIICADGSALDAVSPEALEVLWRRHGGKLLDTSDFSQTSVESTIEEQELRREEARAAILLMASRCTCATDDIALCPNYLPGDEEGDFNDDD